MNLTKDLDCKPRSKCLCGHANFKHNHQRELCNVIGCPCIGFMEVKK